MTLAPRGLDGGLATTIKSFRVWTYLGRFTMKSKNSLDVLPVGGLVIACKTFPISTIYPSSESLNNNAKNILNKLSVKGYCLLDTVHARVATT